MTVQEIARLLEAGFEGDGTLEVTACNAVELASASEIAFVEGDKAETEAAASRAGCLMMAVGVERPAGAAAIRVAQPRNAFTRVLRALHPPVRPEAGIHPSAVVADSGSAWRRCFGGAPRRVGRRSAGRREYRDRCWGDRRPRLEARRRLLGPRGGGHLRRCHGGRPGHFAFRVRAGRRRLWVRFDQDHYEKFPQIGTVEIGNDVEIGANACVDRGALGATVIGDGTKLDNMVHIGHNCRLGKHVVMAAQVGLSGGVVVEDYVVMGGQVGIGEKAHIGAKAVVGGQCGILPFRRVPPGETLWGTPSRPVREHLKKLAMVDRLPKIMAEVKELRKAAETEKGK